MPADSVRVALLGAGGIAPEHAEALGMTPGIELVAVCDRVRTRAQELATRFAIPRAYETPAEMLATERPHVVHVLTPPEGHVPAALECLHAGTDVFVEKPMGISVAECTNLQDTAARLGRTIGVNHTLTYAPTFGGLIDVIRQRKLGRVNHAIVSFSVVPQNIPSRDPNHYVFRSASNAIFEYAPHPFSVIRRLMGRLQRVVTVKSGEVALGGNRSYYHSWQCAMECERGTAQLFLSLGRVKDVTVLALGQDGSALADLGHGTLQLFESTPREITADIYDALTNAKRALKATARRILHHYAVKTGLRPHTAYNAFWLSMNAFYRSRAAGSPVEEGAAAGTAVVEYCEQTVRASGA